MNPVMQSIQEILEENADLKRRILFLEEGADSRRVALQKQETLIKELEKEKSKYYELFCLYQGYRNNLIKDNDKLHERINELKSVLNSKHGIARNPGKSDEQQQKVIIQQQQKIIDLTSQLEHFQSFLVDILNVVNRHGFNA